MKNLNPLAFKLIFRFAIAIILAIFPPVYATDFNIGPYYLGMSHRDASVFGLTQCKEAEKQKILGVECLGQLSGLNEIPESWIKIIFDGKTKKIKFLEAHVRAIPSDGDNFESIQKFLKISPCDANYSNDIGSDPKYSLKRCYTNNMSERYMRVENYCRSGYSKFDFECRSTHGKGRRFFVITATKSDRAREFFRQKNADRVRAIEAKKTQERMSAFSKGH